MPRRWPRSSTACRSCRSRPLTTPIPMPPTDLRNELQLQPLKPAAPGRQGAGHRGGARRTWRHHRVRPCAGRKLCAGADEDAVHRGRARSAPDGPAPSRAGATSLCRRAGATAGGPGKRRACGRSSAGTPGQLHDSAVSAPMVRAALDRLPATTSTPSSCRAAACRIACPASSSFRPPTWASCPAPDRPQGRNPQTDRPPRRSATQRQRRGDAQCPAGRSLACRQNLIQPMRRRIPP
jgi:hypothetical protein